jgi:hypothetical protein
LATHSDKPPLLRTLLILGRVSNLPTVWSNCLAGWLIGGAGEWRVFVQLCVGASLLYVGGMFLNDACDEAFDRQHRVERPIPSGAISSRAVWMLSYVTLGLGALVLIFTGRGLILPALGLLACIVFYDVIHKQTAYAPVAMAGCRFLLYVVAGSAALGGLSAKLLWCAGALAAYIVGLSFIARKESIVAAVCDRRTPPDVEAARRSQSAATGLVQRTQNVKPNFFVLPLFIAPLITGHLGLASHNKLAVGLIGVGYVGWVIWSLWHMIKGGAPAIGRTVSALLAGIVLVDMLAVQGGGGMMPLAFLALFVSALILQRTIPAT